MKHFLLTACLLCLFVVPAGAYVYKGRLPSHYPAVVTPAQRAEIYSIQCEYYDEIQGLKMEIATLEDERNGRVSDVLSIDQKAKVLELGGKVYQLVSPDQPADPTPTTTGPGLQ